MHLCRFVLRDVGYQHSHPTLTQIDLALVAVPFCANTGVAALGPMKAAVMFT